MSRSRLAAATLLATASFAIALSAGPERTAPAAPPDPAAISTQLTATLTDPVNIDLNWKSSGPVAGYFVEFTSEPTDDYVILTIYPRNETTYRHPDLGEETKFIYRVRPYSGPASELVEITTAKVAEGDEIPMVGDDEPPIDQPDAKALAQKKSIRTSATAAAAAPAEFTATLVAPLSVRFRWKDRASDEDGYLLEGAPAGRDYFEAIALLPPDAIGFTIPQLPPDTKCVFRIRPYYYGKPSNVVEKTTGRDPSGNR